MADFEVEFFEKSDGTYPAEEFIFIKKTQKTPPGEIAIAKKYRAERTERSNQNG